MTESTPPPFEEPASGFARVEVRVHWQGKAHWCRLEVTDLAEGAVVLALLEQAHRAVRDNVAHRVQEEFKQRLQGKAAAPAAWFPTAKTQLRAVVDRLFPDEEEEATDKGGAKWKDAPPLPTDGSPLPAQGGQCRAIVVNKTRKASGRVVATRTSCGWQLGSDGSCPNVDQHLKTEPSENPFDPDPCE